MSKLPPGVRQIIADLDREGLTAGEILALKLVERYPQVDPGILGDILLDVLTVSTATPARKNQIDQLIAGTSYALMLRARKEV